MGYKFWKWVYDLSKKKLRSYSYRKCEHCLRWDAEAPYEVVSESDDLSTQITKCSGCGKNTERLMVFYSPVWKSRFPANE